VTATEADGENREIHFYRGGEGGLGSGFWFWH